MAAPPTDLMKALVKLSKKRQVGYLHFPVCTYSGMAETRLEMEEEATNEMICGNRLSEDAALKRNGGL